MFFQHKKYLILIYLIFLFLLIYCTSDVLAANSLTPKEVIKADIIIQNNHDLSTYLSLRTTKVGLPENRNEIMILREKYPEYDILQKTVNYNRQAAYNYANYYWDEVSNDGYYMAIDAYRNTYAVSFPLGTHYLVIKSYFDNHNPKLYGADCAHFVSCCIGNNGGGGLPVLHDYAPNVYGYVGANNLANWILNNYGVVKYSIEELEMGDVILYDSVAGQHIVLYLGDGLIAAHSSCLWGKTNIPFYGKSWIQPDLEVNKLIHINSTIELAPPPELIYPTDNSNIYTTTPTFQWNSVSNADGYGLYIRDIASGEMVYATEEQPLYGASLELPGGILENGKSYWWNMNSYNSAGWGSCCTHLIFTVQVDSYPIVNSFSVTPTSVTLGNSFNISYTVSDDIGLQQTELWRAIDVGGTPDWDTPNNPIKTKVLSGQTNYSGSFTDTPNATGIYYYGMHVVDTSGNWSVEPDPPGPIMVTVTDPTVNPPTGIDATDGTYTDKIRITWNIVNGASYYHVYRATSSGGTKVSLGSWQGSTSYDDTSATPGQTYYYFIKAATSSSGSNASDYSAYNEGWRKLSPPTGIDATDGTYTDKIRITWNIVNGASYYHVYRATSSGGTKVSLGSWQGSTSYDDTSATPGQTYYYFIKAATNSSGYRESDYSSYDQGSCSTSTTPPQVTTNNASSVTASSAQLNGNLDSTGGLPCDVWFEFGKTTSYGTPTTKQSKSSTGSFNQTISSLDPNTTYHFRAKASNTAGSDDGLDKSFITEANTPGTAAFSDVIETSIRANWNANGNPAGTQYYCENTTKGTNSGWITNLSWNSTGLTKDTAYHFQVKAKNANGVETGWTDLGSQVTNTGNLPPQATTNDASNITSTSAQLNGNLDSTGNLSCQVWFEYGKTTSYGSLTTKQSKSSVGPFNDTIISLDPNTTYHFKAYASNSEGTVYGADKIFTTPMLGDFGSANNGLPDCKVDFEDLMIFALAYGSTPSDANWNPVCDIANPGGPTPDGVIDFEDLMVFAMHYGETCADL